ncbi:MAG TPA: hypothetical protein VGF14_00550 [Alphaproteobacteria bacterium]
MKFMTKLLLLGGLTGSLAGAVTGQARAQQHAKPSHGEIFKLNDTEITVQRSVLSEFFTLDQNKDVKKTEEGNYQINLRRGKSIMVLSAYDRKNDKHIAEDDVLSKTLIWYNQDTKHAIHIGYDSRDTLRHRVLWAATLLDDKPVRRLLSSNPSHARGIAEVTREFNQRFHGHDPATNHLPQIDVSDDAAIRLQALFLSEKYKLTEACRKDDSHELVYQAGNNIITVRAQNADDDLVLGPHDITSISLREMDQGHVKKETIISGYGLSYIDAATVNTVDPKTGRVKAEHYFRDNNPDKVNDLTQKVLQEFNGKPR